MHGALPGYLYSKVKYLRLKDSRFSEMKRVLFFYMLFLCILPLLEDYTHTFTSYTVIFPKGLQTLSWLSYYKIPLSFSMEIYRTKYIYVYTKQQEKTYEFVGWFVLLIITSTFSSSPSYLRMLGVAKLMCHQCWSWHVTRWHADGHNIGRAGDYNSLSLR